MTSTVKPDPRNPVHLLACGFGSGLAPKAPGTFGTLAAMPFWWLMATFLPLWGYGLVTLAVCAMGPWICGRTSRDMGVHDSGHIVWDEFAGLFITLAALPVSWGSAVLGFLAFRLFDIWKPGPVGWLDRNLRGGTGIMMDDMAAGVIAALCLQLLYHFLPVVFSA